MPYQSPKHHFSALFQLELTLKAAFVCDFGVFADLPDMLDAELCPYLIAGYVAENLGGTEQ